MVLPHDAAQNPETQDRGQLGALNGEAENQRRVPDTQRDDDAKKVPDEDTRHRELGIRAPADNLFLTNQPLAVSFSTSPSVARIEGCGSTAAYE